MIKRDRRRKKNCKFPMFNSD